MTATTIPVILCAQANWQDRQESIAQCVRDAGPVQHSLVLLATDQTVLAVPDARSVQVMYTAAEHPQACLCCAGQSGLGSVLRDVFMRALRRQLPKFNQVLIEVPDSVDLMAVRNVIRYDAFLAQRYHIKQCLDHGRHEQAPAAGGILQSAME